MNAPTRFLELVDTVQGDRAQLASLDDDLRILHAKTAEKQALRDQVAENVAVVEAMLSHAQRTFELTIPTPAPQNGNGVPPAPASIFNQVAREHPEAVNTAPHPIPDAAATVPDAEPEEGKPVASRGRNGRA